MYIKYRFSFYNSLRYVFKTYFECVIILDLYSLRNHDRILKLINDYVNNVKLINKYNNNTINITRQSKLQVKRHKFIKNTKAVYNLFKSISSK